MKKMNFKFLAFTLFLFVNVTTARTSFGQTKDTVRLYYATNKFSSPPHEHKLDSILSLTNIDRKNIHIIGYADHVATKPYNLKLSARRADDVKNYFIKRLPESEIIAVGKATPV